MDPSDNLLADPVGEFVEETQTRRHGKDGVVEQHQVKVAQPLDLAELAQEVEVGDAQDFGQQRQRRGQDDVNATIENEMRQRSRAEPGSDARDHRDGVQAHQRGDEQIANENDLDDDPDGSERRQRRDAELLHCSLVDGQGPEAGHNLTHVHDDAEQAEAR